METFKKIVMWQGYVHDRDPNGKLNENVNSLIQGLIWDLWQVSTRDLNSVIGTCQCSLEGHKNQTKQQNQILWANWNKKITSCQTLKVYFGQFEGTNIKN